MDEFTGEPPRPEGGGLDDDPGPRGRWVEDRWRPASVDQPTGGAGRTAPLDRPDERGSVTGDGNGNGNGNGKLIHTVRGVGYTVRVS